MNQFKHAKWWRSFLDKLKQAFSYTKASQQKERSKEKQREAKRKIEDSSCSLLSHFWSTYRSPFSTFHIPFQSSGSQESNASNRVRFRAEMRKIWPSEDNCSRGVRNFRTSLEQLSSKGHIFLISAPNRTRFKALDSWLLELWNGI